MSISNIMAISMSGMEAQRTKLAATANNVANAMTPAYDRLETRFSTSANGGVTASVSPSGASGPDDQSNVDLATEMLSLMESEQAFKANASVWESGADMWDVLKTIVRD